VKFNLLPRERRFYRLFQDDVANIVRAAELLGSLLGNSKDDSREQRQSEIRDLEHSGDDLTHEIVRTLNRTFVTPFDREDIYALASGLDDILDYIEEVSQTLSLYKIVVVPAAAGELGDLLMLAAQQLQQALDKLESQKDLEPHWIEVHRIENLGDQVVRRAIGELFADARDPIEVMKLKDLYDLLEDSLDKCEDVANTIENIVIRNA
jgi:predicted phosphate transport protein (TIGR00153 family)